MNIYRKKMMFKIIFKINNNKIVNKKIIKNININKIMNIINSNNKILMNKWKIFTIFLKNLINKKIQINEDKSNKIKLNLLK